MAPIVSLRSDVNTTSHRHELHQPSRSIVSIFIQLDSPNSSVDRVVVGMISLRAESNAFWPNTSVCSAGTWTRFRRCDSENDSSCVSPRTRVWSAVLSTG